MSVTEALAEVVGAVGAPPLSALDQARASQLVIVRTHGDGVIHDLRGVRPGQLAELRRHVEAAINQSTQNAITRGLGQLLCGRASSVGLVGQEHEGQHAEDMAVGDTPREVVGGRVDAGIVGEAHWMLLFHELAKGPRVAGCGQ